MKAIKIQDLEISNVKFCEKRPYGLARKVVIKYNKRPLIIQLPEFVTPFGLNDKYSWAVNLNISDKDVIENLENLEVFLLENALVNSKVWFGLEKSYEELKKDFNNLIKKSDKYDPQLKLKVYPENVILLDSNKSQINFNKQKIISGDSVRTIFCIEGVYILSNGTFGYITRLRAAIHHPQNSSINLIDF